MPETILLELKNTSNGSIFRKVHLTYNISIMMKSGSGRNKFECPWWNSTGRQWEEHLSIILEKQKEPR